MSSSESHTDISQETVEDSNTESSIVIKENTNGFQQLFIEIAAGEDIVSTLVNLAQSRQAAGIVVLGGSGDISDVTLSHPESCTPFSPDQGSFHMTRLCGTHINVNDDCIPPRFMDTYGGPSFSILFHDNHGQNFGGIIKGEIMTAGVVSVQAYLLRKPKFRRLDINGIAEGIEEDDDSIYGDEEEEDDDDDEGDSDDDDEEDDDDDEEGDSDDDGVFINAVHGLVALKSAN